MSRPILWDQSDDVIKKFQQKAYHMLLGNGVVQSSDQPIEDSPNVQRVYDLAEELFEISQYVYGSIAEDLK
jgi:hypothetical protein